MGTPIPAPVTKHKRQSDADTLEKTSSISFRKTKEVTRHIKRRFTYLFVEPPFSQSLSCITNFLVIIGFFFKVFFDFFSLTGIYDQLFHTVFPIYNKKIDVNRKMLFLFSANTFLIAVAQIRRTVRHIGIRIQ